VLVVSICLFLLLCARGIDLPLSVIVIFDFGIVRQCGIFCFLFYYLQIY
jgi:hypothetical protein